MSLRERFNLPPDGWYMINTTDEFDLVEVGVMAVEATGEPQPMAWFYAPDNQKAYAHARGTQAWVANPTYQYTLSPDDPFALRLQALVAMELFDTAREEVVAYVSAHRDAAEPGAEQAHPVYAQPAEAGTLGAGGDNY